MESVNGRLKRWKYLANIVPNTQIPFLADDLKLVGALCNKYKPPLNTGNQEDDQILAAKMKVWQTYNWYDGNLGCIKIGYVA